MHIRYHLSMLSPIVVDTSVFISALIGPNGPSREILRRCLQQKYQPLMGNALFLEYEAVSSRTKIVRECALTTDEIEAIVAAFLNTSKWTSIYYTWRPNLTDEGDNHLIELAIAGNARSIVTNNLKDFRNAELLFPNLKIVKPEELLKES